MKTLFFTLIALFTTAQLIAGPDNSQNPYEGSASFERMKTLEGQWKGMMQMGEQNTEVAVEYRVVAGGSALEERIFAGTPREMVTIYHDKQGKLALTHYCMLRNQPGMTLETATDDKLSFVFDELCGIDAKTEMHMHSMTLTFHDDGSITHDWKLYADGQPQESDPFTLKRIES